MGKLILLINSAKKTPLKGVSHGNLRAVGLDTVIKKFTGSGGSDPDRTSATLPTSRFPRDSTTTPSRHD